MAPKNKRDEQIVRAWKRFQLNWWASDELQDANRHTPERAWRLLGKVAKAATNDELANALGAGPLQDFIRHHAPRFIDRIERRAKKERWFGEALKSAWLPRAGDRVSMRLFELGVIAIGASREKWQTG